MDALFIISVIVCSIFGSFFSMIVDANLMEGKSAFARWVVGILVALAFGLFLTGVMWGEAKMDADAYNGGVCSICEGDYDFRGGSEYRGSHTYYYTCKDCGHTIETNSLMK